MKTTMNFASKTKKDNIISMASSIGNGTAMTLLRSKSPLEHADKLIAVYDEETGHLRIGMGPKAKMESVSGVKVVNNTTDLPAQGKTDTLYVCIDTGSSYVWSAEVKTWFPVGRGSGGGSVVPATPQNQVVIVSKKTGLPATGKSNVIYVTRQNEAFVYDIYTNKYIQMSKDSSDSHYTKEESDEKYATKKDLESVSGGHATSICAHVKDVFYVEDPDKNTFTLSEEPKDEISVFVNGVLYSNTKAETNYILDKANKKVTWVNTSEDTGGFTLEESTVIIEYTVNNPIPDASSVAKGVVKLYENTGDHTDGAVTQKAFKVAMLNISKEIEEIKSKLPVTSV